jgi:hypothetical protein
MSKPTGWIISINAYIPIPSLPQFMETLAEKQAKLDLSNLTIIEAYFESFYLPVNYHAVIGQLHDIAKKKERTERDEFLLRAGAVLLYEIFFSGEDIVDTYLNLYREWTAKYKR